MLEKNWLWKEKKVKPSLKNKGIERRLAETFESWTLVEKFMNSESIWIKDAISVLKWLESWRKATVDLLKIKHKNWFPYFALIKRFENATLSQINWPIEAEAKQYEYDEVFIYFEAYN